MSNLEGGRATFDTTEKRLGITAYSAASQRRKRVFGDVENDLEVTGPNSDDLRGGHVKLASQIFKEPAVPGGAENYLRDHIEQGKKKRGSLFERGGSERESQQLGSRDRDH